MVVSEYPMMAPSFLPVRQRFAAPLFVMDTRLAERGVFGELSLRPFPSLFFETLYFGHGNLRGVV